MDSIFIQETMPKTDDSIRESYQQRKTEQRYLLTLATNYCIKHKPGGVLSHNKKKVDLAFNKNK